MRFNLKRLVIGFVLILGLGGITIALADITDPVLPTTVQFLPTDQIQGVVRNGHQNLAGSLWQLAQGGGEQVNKCSMVSATTCTITLVNAYTQAAPICISEDQSGFIASHATAAQNSTTLTVTAASSQSDTFVADCSGNPY